MLLLSFRQQAYPCSIRIPDKHGDREQPNYSSSIYQALEPLPYNVSFAYLFLSLSVFSLDVPFLGYNINYRVTIF